MRTLLTILIYFRVILYCVAQLSENPELNIITLDKFAAANDVTKDTVKKLWN